MKFPQWLHRAAGSVLAAAALAVTPIADAQSVLSEPDFSGMNGPTGSAQFVARDAVRGWTYASGSGTTHINGIQVGAFSRLNDFGQIDLSWTGELARPFLRGALLLGNGELMFSEGLLVAPKSLTAFRVLDERAVVTTCGTDGRPLVSLISLVDGHVLSSRVVPLGVTPSLVDPGGTVVLNDTSSFALWSPSATDFVARDVAIKTGQSPAVTSIKRWGAGYVIGGNFEYVHSAIRYANLMRLGADFKPDPIWQAGVTGIVNALAVDLDGGLIVGGDRLLSPTSSLISFWR